MNKIIGIAASEGISIGKAFYVQSEHIDVPKKKISFEDISREIYRLEEALIETRKEIGSLQRQIDEKLGYDHAKIFEAHMLVLEDRLLIEDIINQIKNKRINVEYAFSQSVKKYIDILQKLDDAYLKERAYDIEDVAKRVLRKMLNLDMQTLEHVKEKVIIVAHDLSPSETASLPKANILGFVTDVGGRTAHTAIIARNLGIPAVVGTKSATEHIQSGDTLIVDGAEGIVYINPSQKTIKEYQARIKAEGKQALKIHIPKTLKSQTKDKKRLIVSVNIELPEELPMVDEYKAEGVGLYRTEYLFLGKKDLPNEEEQYKAYSQVARKIKPHSVIIRTIDIGGDKFLSKPDLPREMTPFLGWRAIRFCLANPHIFKQQLRAILRASYGTNIKIMFPMISGVEEVREAKNILEECKKELKKEGKKFDDKISVGVMIEVPSAALTAHILAKECDFFSIGTNDLIQYSLAIDRADEKVAHLYAPAHPAVLQLIKGVIDAAHANDIWVGMCGEMAGEALFAVLLVGFGIDELSMPPRSIPRIKEIISKIRYSDAKKIADECFQYGTAKEMEAFLQERVQNILKDDLSKYL
ncbi:MAG: phosphoenolpyruvate--protein phosphotransferase [Candidatus Omnitrophica bacterium]|nr:phosphoenolpyruvate--protein phosphotransferase [Candidatus Omnitrophota bacterium]